MCPGKDPKAWWVRPASLVRSLIVPIRYPFDWLSPLATDTERIVDKLRFKLLTDHKGAAPLAK